MVDGGWWSSHIGTTVWGKVEMGVVGDVWCAGKS